MRLSYRLVSGLLVLASIVGMSFALYLEHVKGLEPCPLCIFQRVGLMAMGFVALI
ncbi:dihydrolipoamide acetyltransferase, partial [Acinetobacter baumannii]